MQDVKDSAKRLRAEADNSERVARSATDLEKRELYEHLALHFRKLADDLEKTPGGPEQGAET